MGIFFGGSFPGGNCPVGIIRVAIFQVGVFMLPLNVFKHLMVTFFLFVKGIPPEIDNNINVFSDF